MRLPLRWLVCILFVAPLSACQDETPVSPATDATSSSGARSSPEQVALEMMEGAGWAAVDESGNRLVQDAAPEKGSMPFVDRQMLTDDVAHYSFQVRVGPGLYDVIGIHRVVRESAPYRPIRTRSNLFLQHGDYQNFAGCFLPGLVSPHVPDDVGFAVYLAEQDIDVWGIDQAWCLVPASETDFAFMAGWDMQRQVDDLAFAVETARILRRMTGNGYHPMLLSGYSTGGPMGFALLNEETQLPSRLRKIAGFVPVDQGLKTDDPVWEETCCGISASYQGLLDGGQYQDYSPLPIFGELARNDPDGASPLIEGVTNLQAALILGTFPFFEGISAHFLAGDFDETGLPTGLKFVDTDAWIDFLYYAPPYEPAAYLRDEYDPSCTDATPYDDYLGEIEVPILYVKARGGFGYTGEYTLDLLGSTDVSVIEASWGAEDPLLEFGHIDLFLAADAPSQTWQPIADWVHEHARPGGHGGHLP